MVERWALAVITVALAGCGGGDSDPAEPSGRGAEKPSKTEAESSASKGVGAASSSSPGEKAASVLEDRYRELRLSFARSPPEKRELARRIDTFTTMKADCSKTQRKQVFNCSMSLASPGYAPGIEQYRFIISEVGYRIIPQ